MQEVKNILEDYLAKQPLSEVAKIPTMKIGDMLVLKFIDSSNYCLIVYHGTLFSHLLEFKLVLADIGITFPGIQIPRELFLSFYKSLPIK